MEYTKRIRQMIINITDLCNMECSFCLRGDGNGRKMDLSLIPRMFEDVSSVDAMTITGGDPSCYMEAVTAIADYLVDHRDDIDVWGFYIITNGKEYKQELVDVVKRLLFLSIEKSYGDIYINGPKDAKQYGHYPAEELKYSFGLSVSMDEYHEPIDLMNYIRYFYSGVYSDSKETDFSGRSVIGRGRAVGFINAHERKYYPFSVSIENENTVEAEEVYITVTGKVFADCDMSYDMEEEYEPAGDLHEETLAQIMQRYGEELEDEFN